MKRKFIKQSVMIVVCVGIVVCVSCRTTEDSQNTKAKTSKRIRKSIPLAGQWLFKLDPANLGEKEKWFNSKLPDQINLPGSTTGNGFGNDISLDTKWTGSIIDKSFFTDEKYEKYRQPGSIKIPFWLTPVKHYKGPAWYQKQVDIPTNWTGKRIILFLPLLQDFLPLWTDRQHHIFDLL